MPQVVVERLDHLVIIAGVIKDLGIVEFIDSRIDTAPKEEITTGEAIAGMILNGLGFSNRPLSLTPQFFQNKPLDVLFREGVKADHFNRFKLGRSLDAVSAYGCELLFSELSVGWWCIQKKPNNALETVWIKRWNGKRRKPGKRSSTCKPNALNLSKMPKTPCLLSPRHSSITPSKKWISHSTFAMPRKAVHHLKRQSKIFAGKSRRTT